MNLVIVGIILAVLVILHLLRVPILIWLPIWPLAVYALIRFGFTTPVPASVLQLYLALTILALLVYLVTDSERYQKVKAQLINFITDKKYTVPLWSVVIALPLFLAYKTYLDRTVEVKVPTFGRTIHPAPPDQITFQGKTIDLIKGKNPYRAYELEDPEQFKAHLLNGKRVYVQNCVLCHGDDLRGQGMFAHGLQPVPANFNSATTIAMLQEAYLFWRIAKGGPGLPDESGPWSSSMPAWENFLSAEEIWDVILYLYDHTGLTPRAEEEGH